MMVGLGLPRSCTAQALISLALRLLTVSNSLNIQGTGIIFGCPAAGQAFAGVFLHVGFGHCFSTAAQAGIGAGIGGLVLVAVVLGIIFFMRRRKRRNNKAPLSEDAKHKNEYKHRSGGATDCSGSSVVAAACRVGKGTICGRAEEGSRCVTTKSTRTAT